jgi:hypothetical protein
MEGKLCRKRAGLESSRTMNMCHAIQQIGKKNLLTGSGGMA